MNPGASNRGDYLCGDCPNVILYYFFTVKEKNTAEEDAKTYKLNVKTFVELVFRIETWLPLV